MDCYFIYRSRFTSLEGMAGSGITFFTAGHTRNNPSLHSSLEVKRLDAVLGTVQKNTFE